MLRLFYPWEYAEDIYGIDYRKLFARGFRGLIFDIDNTLVPHGADSTPDVDAFFRELKDIGFQTLVLSNNDEERVLRFLKNIDALYICDANKPYPKSYHKAVDMLGGDRKKVVCIGDQVFTDIFGANLSGILSILVHFIRKPGETDIGIRRKTEQKVLRFYWRSKSMRHRLGDILLSGKEEGVI